MTSDALMTTVTLPLALMPSSSTASLVIDAVTILPPPISTRTCEVVAPLVTSVTVPLSWLRALMRISFSQMLSHARIVRASERLFDGNGEGTVVPDRRAFTARGHGGH